MEVSVIHDCLDKLEDLGYDQQSVQRINKALLDRNVHSRMPPVLKNVFAELASSFSGRNRVLGLALDDFQRSSSWQDLVHMCDLSGSPYAVSPTLSKHRDVSEVILQRAQMLDFLLGETMAERIIHLDKTSQRNSDNAQTIASNDALQCIAALKAMSHSYDIGSSSDSSATSLLHSITDKVRNALKNEPNGVLPAALIPVGYLSPDQMSLFEEINQKLSQDYSDRCEMLTTRFAALIRSMLWSSRAQSVKDSIIPIVDSYLHWVPRKIYIHSDEIFLARPMLFDIRIAVASADSQHLRQITIGSVPDRGGRPGQARRQNSKTSQKHRK